MFKMKPPKVYVHESVYENELAKKRLDRMLANIETDDLKVVDDALLDEAVVADGLLNPGAKRTGQLKLKSDPIIIFNTYRFASSEEYSKLVQKYPHLRAYSFGGNGPWGFRDASRLKGVCRSAYEIHSAWGCYHACDYCHIKHFLNIMMNLEEYVEHLDELVKREPWQKLYKYDNQTDTICFEPEYGASEVLVNYFAKQKDQYLMLYTKSNNVEHLLDLDHKGHTIISWSLSCSTVAREIEKKTPSTEQRIQAAADCQKAGYTVRFRFSPLIPIKNWREENRDMIQKLFSKVKPDVITIDMLGWMTAKQIMDSMDMSLFDDEYRAIVEKLAADDVKNVEKQILPHPARLKFYRYVIEEIRRVDDRVPIAICMENREMWDDLEDELGMTADDHVCCCDPLTVPGHPMLAS